MCSLQQSLHHMSPGAFLLSRPLAARPLLPHSSTHIPPRAFPKARPSTALADLTPAQVRLACRNNEWKLRSTAGVCDGHVQVNLLVIPERFAKDFRTFCDLNLRSCPVIYESSPGDPYLPSYLVSTHTDLSTDFPSYALYQNSLKRSTQPHLKREWKNDSVAFLIGCSYTFESALNRFRMTPRHVELGRNVPMYKTNKELVPFGRFHGTTIVSMRPYLPTQLPLINNLTRPFTLAHSSPISFGSSALSDLGIDDPLGIEPDFGDPTIMKQGEVPVYWACGVTAQHVVMNCLKQEQDVVVCGHEPGKMLVLDLKEEDVCKGGSLAR